MKGGGEGVQKSLDGKLPRNAKTSRKGASGAHARRVIPENTIMTS